MNYEHDDDDDDDDSAEEMNGLVLPSIPLLIYLGKNPSGYFRSRWKNSRAELVFNNGSTQRRFAFVLQ